MSGVRRLALGAGFLAVCVGGAGGASATPAARPLQLSTVLPAWLAPEAPLRVSGWAGSGETVRLVANGRTLATARSGRLGRFLLRAPAPRRFGRYSLALRAGDRRADVGRLVVRPVVLAAVGDVNLGDRVGEAIRSYGSGYPWSGVAALLTEADISIANLECAISARGSAIPGKHYTFRGAPSSLPAAARAGLDVVTVANNHSLDFGSDAFADTLRFARRAGLATIGGGTLATARRPLVVHAGGLRIALLGYSDVRPLGFDATATHSGTLKADPLVIASDVSLARRRSDAVVVYFHWGEELHRSPSARQRSLAAVALGAGATVVLGAHPHVLQPVERRGRTLVAWSLGNFVFSASSAGTSATGVLLVGLERRGVRWSELIPAHIANARPTPDPARARGALKRLRAARATA